MLGADQYGRAGQLCGTHRLRGYSSATTAPAAYLFRDVLLVVDGQRLASDQRGMFRHERLFVSAAIFTAWRLLRTC
jgi:hypothetical protein